MSVKEGAVTQTIASSACGSRRDSWSVVRHTPSLYERHVHVLFHFWRSVDVLFIRTIPTSGVAGFSIKRDISDEPSIGFMQLCHYFSLALLLKWSWCSFPDQRHIIVIMGQDLNLPSAPHV